MLEEHKLITPRLLVLITDIASAKKAKVILQQAGAIIQYRCKGRGTATSEVMDYLGLDGSEKTILLCLVPRSSVSNVIQALTKDLELRRLGRGIIFTLPINGISNPAMRLLDSQQREEIMKRAESEVEQMTANANHSLILIMINQGYSEDVMETAKEAGAKGGTVIHARRIGMEESMKLWGICVQGEKEIIAILASKEERPEIMRAVGRKYGMRSEARGMLLSMPVDEIDGI